MDVASHSMGEHGAALVALLYLPVAVVALLAALQVAADRGVSLARRFMAGLGQLRGAHWLALLLVAVTATVHAALVPALADEPLTAALFCLDAAALGAVCVAGPLLRGWRPLAAVLLAGNLAAYAAYLAAGLETPDAVGLGTKLIEALALVLVLLPQARAAATAGSPQEVSAP
jgi:hypothetical protein